MRRWTALIGLLLFWSCKDDEELITQPYVGYYQLENISISYEGTDLLLKTPLISDLQKLGFSLSNDFTYAIDTSFIDYFFFLRPGVALSEKWFMGVWSLDDHLGVLSADQEFISFSLDNNFFYLDRLESNRIKFSTVTNSSLYPVNDQSYFFRAVGQDNGKLTAQDFSTGATTSEGEAIGTTYGYYSGYHSRYLELSADLTTAEDPIDQYAIGYLSQIDTTVNQNSAFLDGFRSGLTSGITQGQLDANQFFTEGAKSLDFAFQFERTP